MHRISIVQQQPTYMSLFAFQHTIDQNAMAVKETVSPYLMHHAVFMSKLTVKHMKLCIWSYDECFRLSEHFDCISV